MSKKKANIRPDLVGEYYLDEERTVFLLEDCHTEPTATFRDIVRDIIETKSISEFSNMVLMKPVKPIEKKQERKLRADKGTHRTKKQEESVWDTTQIPKEE